MIRTLANLCVAVAVLANPAQSFARGVHFGAAPRVGFFHGGFDHPGFVDRRLFFGGFAGPRIAFAAPSGYYPYPVYPYYPPYPMYVVP
jgi:hypothetical protein